MRDIINTDEFVALPWSDEDETVAGVLYGETGGWFIREDFNELFEVVGKFLGESRESYYQGLSFTAVIKRKSDGKLFGHTYWEDIPSMVKLIMRPMVISLASKITMRMTNTSMDGLSLHR